MSESEAKSPLFKLTIAAWVVVGVLVLIGIAFIVLGFSNLDGGRLYTSVSRINIAVVMLESRGDIEKKRARVRQFVEMLRSEDTIQTVLRDPQLSLEVKRRSSNPTDYLQKQVNIRLVDEGRGEIGIYTTADDPQLAQNLNLAYLGVLRRAAGERDYEAMRRLEQKRELKRRYERTAQRIERLRPSVLDLTYKPNQAVWETYRRSRELKESYPELHGRLNAELARIARQRLAALEALEEESRATAPDIFRINESKEFLAQRDKELEEAYGRAPRGLTDKLPIAVLRKAQSDYATTLADVKELNTNERDQAAARYDLALLEAEVGELRAEVEEAEGEDHVVVWAEVRRPSTLPSDGEMAQDHVKKTTTQFVIGAMFLVLSVIVGTAAFILTIIYFVKR